ncbi:hypothetical protein AALA00_13650 [Lachnospiraceae bacterium 46-15]
MGTKSQQILKLQQEQLKIERRIVSQEQREAEKQKDKRGELKMEQNYLKEYVPIDLHVHTPASDCYNRKCDSLEDEYISLVKMYSRKGH